MWHNSAQHHTIIVAVFLAILLLHICRSLSEGSIRGGEGGIGGGEGGQERGRQRAPVAQ